MSQETKVSFYNPLDFVDEIGLSGKQIRLRTNEKSGAKSVAIGPKSFKAQSDLDVSKPMAFLLEKGKDMSEACLVNTEGLKEEVISFQ